MVVVLPVPLTPTTRMTCGLRAGSRSSGLATGSRICAISRGERVAHVLGRDVLVEARRGELGGQLRRRRQAEIGGDQHVLQLLERLVVELAAR